MYAIIAAVVVSWVRSYTRIGIKGCLRALVRACKGIVSISAVCGCAGIITGIVSLTGLGLKMSRLIVTLSHGNLLLALLITTVVLTILGYSINDTIVIYDRIRENRRIYGQKLPVGELVNKSINQSMKRAIVTTVTTVMALVVIAVVTLIFNVTPIVTFVFPLIIGLLSGTYSSVCLVPCMWVMWQEYRAKKAQQTDAKKK